MKNMNSEQLYYKVENKDCDLFKRANIPTTLTTMIHSNLASAASGAAQSTTTL